MKLSPREVNKLILHGAGVLAQKRLARGLRLNHPEAVALVATQVLEFIREGKSVAELMDLGKHLLGKRQVLPGVPYLVESVQVEGTFRDGTKLVTIHDPFSSEDGDLALALHGSFLPVPPLGAFQFHMDAIEPGKLIPASGDIVINQGRRAVMLTVSNRAD